MQVVARHPESAVRVSPMPKSRRLSMCGLHSFGVRKVVDGVLVLFHVAPQIGSGLAMQPWIRWSCS